MHFRKKVCDLAVVALVPVTPMYVHAASKPNVFIRVGGIDEDARSCNVSQDRPNQSIG